MPSEAQTPLISGVLVRTGTAQGELTLTLKAKDSTTYVIQVGSMPRESVDECLVAQRIGNPVEVVIDDEGVLQILQDGRVILAVGPSRDVEGWQISGSDGSVAVALADGGWDCW
jgi:hypothetical protein